MSTVSETCWTMIEAAARGDEEERTRFCLRYLPIVERSLSARWRSTPPRIDIADAAQEVMLECLRSGGALERVERHRSERFRGFLFGVTRNVARRHESRAQRRREVELQSTVESQEATLDSDLARAFDRAWAEAMVREAGEKLRQWAAARSPAARRRVEILDLRFGKGLSEVAVAERFGLPVKRIEKDFARVRGEFLAMLRQIVAWHGVTEGDDPDQECRVLLSLLSKDG